VRLFHGGNFPELRDDPESRRLAPAEAFDKRRWGPAAQAAPKNPQELAVRTFRMSKVFGPRF
jgi:hypothetical protein